MKEIEAASKWFVMTSTRKTQVACPACHSLNISYHCYRAPGLKGISRTAYGITPACLDCGKNLPTPKNRGKNFKTFG